MCLSVLPDLSNAVLMVAESLICQDTKEIFSEIIIMWYTFYLVFGSLKHDMKSSVCDNYMRATLFAQRSRLSLAGPRSAVGRAPDS